MDDDRLAERLQRPEQLELLAHEVKARTVAEVAVRPTFAAGLLGVADEQQDRIRPTSGLDRLRNPLAVLRRVAELDRLYRDLARKR